MNRADCYKLIYELETNDKSREAVEIHDNDRYDHLIPIYDALGKNTSVEALFISDYQLWDDPNDAERPVDDICRALCNAIQKNTCLKELNLSQNSIGGGVLIALCEALAKNTSIGVFSITDNSMQDERATPLAKLITQNSFIHTLDISNNRFGTAGLKEIFTALYDNATITTLRLSGNTLGDEGAKILAHALDYTLGIRGHEHTFRELDLSSTSLSDEGMLLLSQALQQSTIARIDLSHNEFGLEGAKALAEALTVNKHLQSLYLEHNEMGEEAIIALVKSLHHNNTLEQLSLVFNGVNDECAKELADALKVNTSLQNFNLVENYIGDEGITAIAEALKSPTTVVHSLYLCGNDITEKGATAIASMLESNDTVKSITLSGNEARDAGTAALFRALTKNRSLTQLDLSNNLIGAAGMRAVKKCLVTNETLTELSFAQNGLGNGDIHILASALPTNTALRALDLEENLVTNEGVRVILENMERNHSMELLHLTMSEEDTRQMKAIVQRNIKERVTRNMFWYQLAPMTVGLRASTYIDSRGAREDDRNNNLKHSPSSSGAINLNSYDEDNGKDMLDKDDNCNHDNGNGSNSSRSSSRKTDDSDNDDGKDKGSTTCHYSNLSRHAHNSKADNENCNSINHTKQKSNTSALYRIRNSIRFSSILPCIRSYLIGEDQAVDCSQPCKASSTSVSGNTSVQVTEKHGMNGRALDLFMNGSFMQSMEKGLPVTADNMTKEELWIMFDERQRQRRDVDQLRQRNRVLTAVIAKLNAEIDGHGERNAELRKEQMTLSEKMKNVSEMNLALVQEAKTRESEMSVLRAKVTQLEIQLSMNQHGDSTDASDACGNINPDTRSGLRKKRKL